MDIRRKHSGLKIFVGSLIGFALVSILSFIGIQYFTKTGIFRIPGVVIYDETSLSSDELELLHSIFSDEIDLDKDVRISVNVSDTKPELKTGEFLYDIILPVTDFYDARTDTNEFEPGGFREISFSDLDYTKKLLSVNGKYYLDTFNEGAKYRTLVFESEKYEEEIAPLIGDTFKKTWPESSSVLTFAQTGVTALSRGMNTKLYKVGDASYFAENIKDFLSSFDLTHTSNESSFTDYASSSNICSDKRFIDTLTAIGLDIVELTGNHNQDCGDYAAEETIDIYKENGIKVVGGGKTADEASVPLEIDQKGSKITMLAYNLSTGGATYDNTPGANQYYNDVAAEQIAAAKARGDFVIVDIQYYECNAYVAEYEDSTCDYADSSAGDQVGFFREIIDLGADIVVGTSAHQPQTYELYNGGAIYYGLGNLFFDQVWWPGTTRSLVLVHHFYNGKLLQTQIVPTVYDNDMQTKVLDKETAEWFLSRLIDARP